MTTTDYSFTDEQEEMLSAHAVAQHTRLTLQPKMVSRQFDGLEEEISLATRTPVGTTSMTRQEFAEEADINYLLTRFGVNQAGRANPEYGMEIDYSMDLQQALQAAEAGRNAHAQMPPELRSLYPTWAHMAAAIENGEYQKSLEKLEDRRNMETAWEEQKRRPKTPEPEAPKTEKEPKGKKTDKDGPED